MRKRQSPKRKKSKPEPAQEPQPQIEEVSYETSDVEEHANVLFKPNPGPQTDFLQQNVKYYMEDQQVVVKVMLCLQTHYDIWDIHSLVDCCCDIQQKN